MKRLGVLQFYSPRQDASPSQVTPPQFVNFSQQFASTCLLWELTCVLPKNATQCLRPGPEPRLLTLGMNTQGHHTSQKSATLK